MEFTGDTTESTDNLGDNNIMKLANISEHVDLLMVSSLETSNLQIDEIHLLNTSRGSTLEVIVSRTKMEGGKTRMVVVSATISNPNSIAKWIGWQGLATVKIFGEEYRPVKLIKDVIGYQTRGKKDFLFDQTLDYHLMDVIQKHSDNRPTLIKSTVHAAEILAKDSSQRGAPFLELHEIERKKTLSHNISDIRLRGLVIQGVAYHNSGLNQNDRKIIEEMFDLYTCGGRYSGAGYAEYSDIDILQMIGRAGRPQFDTLGKAVIMTEQTLVPKYASLINGMQDIESCLHENLVEHLNAQVCIGQVRSNMDAINWYCTENMAHYKIGPVNRESIAPEKQLEFICANDLELLEKNRMLERKGDVFYATEIGQTMARNYVRFKSVALIVSGTKACSMQRMLELLVQCEEFSEVRFHLGEKTALNNIIKSPEIRFPVSLEKPPKAKTIPQKVNLAIQCALANITYSNFKINPNHAIETNMILKDSSRLCKGVQYARSLKDIGIDSLETLAAADPRKIELPVRSHSFKLEDHSNESFIDVRLLYEDYVGADISEILQLEKTDEPLSLHIPQTVQNYFTKEKTKPQRSIDRLPVIDLDAEDIIDITSEAGEESQAQEENKDIISKEKPQKYQNGEVKDDSVGDFPYNDIFFDEYDLVKALRIRRVTLLGVRT
ncbi:ATP-dependent DNA helicase MER3 [Entomophthora muscae]|uniref:ATP-dependent DNA helicase MER3 n=1 Tax=Entomophthora muscae TaxID=34485 RepID=A0ACC2TIT8_9FUNG|nr:ATP-dependent DNA helicase MER3 [Entomophthora muscae]